MTKKDVFKPIFLGFDEVMAIHSDQIERYGGSLGVREIELLKSAIAMPESGFGGEYLHVDIFEMAGAYLFHIAKNHPFVDGNKRTGAISAVVFLLLNGVELNADEDSFEKMVWSVADGTMSKSEVTIFLRENSKG